jgi:ADP-dependent phosphofructokinase/glucokinase
VWSSSDHTFSFQEGNQFSSDANAAVALSRNRFIASSTVAQLFLDLRLDIARDVQVIGGDVVECALIARIGSRVHQYAILV